MNDEPFSCGGFDPYNSATTNANWFFANAGRSAERVAAVGRFLEAVRKNPKFFANMIFGALDRAIRG